MQKLPGGLVKGDKVASRIDFDPQSLKVGDIGTILGPCPNNTLADQHERARCDFGPGKGHLDMKADLQIELVERSPDASVAELPVEELEWFVKVTWDQATKLLKDNVGKEPDGEYKPWLEERSRSRPIRPPSPTDYALPYQAYSSTSTTPSPPPRPAKRRTPKTDKAILRHFMLAEDASMFDPLATCERISTKACLKTFTVVDVLMSCDRLHRQLPRRHPYRLWCSRSCLPRPYPRLHHHRYRGHRSLRRLRPGHQDL